MDKARLWIKEERALGKSWDELKLAKRSSEEGLVNFLENAKIDYHWPAMTVAEWKALVEEEKKNEEDLNRMLDAKGSRVICASNEINQILASTDEGSAWQTYKQKLLSNGFSRQTVNMIEGSAAKTLRMISTDTREIGAVKGLVVGNVQSGKTANMAALMAMAADAGWNMFVVLSGMTNNLRAQTIDRLISDLKGSDLNWINIDNPSAKSPYGMRLGDLSLVPESKQRYLCVSVKNKTRLTCLLNWLTYKPDNRENVKMLIIDDESDQAGINTSEKDRTKINELILRLVNNFPAKGVEKSENPLRAINYIGYTATPYANVLNEAPGENSLYPADFIVTLPVSDEYFGPQQIFGLDTEDVDDVPKYPGLDIIRTIRKKDVDLISDIHSGHPSVIPESLTDAICWFLCGVGYMRYVGFSKPVSMLVHTSSQVIHHNYVAGAVEYWLKNSDPNRIVKKCWELWDRETARFNMEDFLSCYPDYAKDRDGVSISETPGFEDIREKILELLKVGIKNILVNDTEHKAYTKGIHLCIDNSNKSDNQSVIRKLIYPAADEMPDVAPAFIVVGGNTLSRGLTIEGLVSAYFLRASKTSDTLMQMGRWFGYRKGYELIPRIWMTELTRQRFEFISIMDQKLRDEIRMMSDNNFSPSEAGPKIMTSPSAKFLQIAASNKIRGAKAAEYDFAGHTMETGVFRNVREDLSKNLKMTADFIRDLGHPDRSPNYNPLAKGNHIWRGVPLDAILDFMDKYKYSERLKGFNDHSALAKWLKKSSECGTYGCWNVVLAGRQIGGESRTWSPVEGITVGKVNRTRKLISPDGESMNIGTLRSFSDFLSDIPVKESNDKLCEELHKVDHNLIALNDFRKKAGLGSTPQLVIYVIDRDSRPNSNNRKGVNRYPLEAVEDVVGFTVNIPGYSDRRSTVQSVTIDLKKKQMVEPDIIDE